MGVFRFKQFEIDDSNCGMKVGTDSVLLGAWTPRPPGNRGFKVLDVGTGSGLLALMIAQRFSEAYITGVEIDQSAAEMAQLNVTRSTWSDRIEILAHDILSCETIKWELFDMVISNPPFYIENVHSPDANRSLARHGENFNVLTLIDVATRHLAPLGLLSFIAPISRHDDIIYKATVSRLNLIATCDVSQRPSRPVTRRLYLFANGKMNRGELNLFDYNRTTPTSIIINSNTGQPSEQYRSLTRDFYRNF